MFLSNASIRRPVAMSMGVLSLVVLGLFSYFGLPVDLMPDVEFPVVTVRTIYPGAGPSEIETLITEPIEEEVTSIAGVKHVTSTSMEAVSVVVVEFDIGTSVDVAAMDVKDKVEAIRLFLPEDIEPPTVQKFDIRAMPIMDLAISSTRPLEEVYELTEDVIKLRLSAVEGLASVEIVGGKEREIVVGVRRDRLSAYGLTIADVLRGIAQQNMEIPGGRITEGRREYSLRLAGRFHSVREIEDLQFVLPNAGLVKLTDLADVVDTFEEQRELARFNGRTSVGVSLIKRPDANTVQVADRVRRALDVLTRTLPEDVHIDIARDRSMFIRQAIQDVIGNLLIGILLTAGVLYLFLHTWRGTVIAAVAMPTSIVATFILLRFAGFTINFMTLMGLAISVGVLVTNSIVVLENIQRYADSGREPRSAAEIGTSEVGVAVLASTLTNVVVFMPIAFMAGIVGQFFKQFGLTVTFATMFSLLVSFTLTPMLASRLIRTGTARTRRGPLAWLAATWDRFYDDLALDYRNALRWTVDHRMIVVILVIFLFVGSLYIGGKYLGSEFFPQADQGSLSVTLEMPAGTSVARTDRALRRVEQVVSGIPEVESVYTVLGKTRGRTVQGVHLGELVVQLRDERTRSTDEVTNALRPLLSDIPAADIVVTPVSPFGGGGAGLQIEITGEQMDRLMDLSEQLKGIVGETPGAVDVASDWEIGKPEVKFLPKRDQLASYALSVSDLATALRMSIEGHVASKYRVGDKEYDIRVRLRDEDRASVDRTRELLLRKRGFSVPITQVASIERGAGPTQISRKDRRRMITVTANIASGSLGQVQGQIARRIREMDLPPGYAIHFGGQSEMMAESFASILQALILAIILTYMVLAGILESYIHPFTIMLTLPLGLIGVILALLITGNTISIFSLMAMVMLVGIVVNNAILLIDYINVIRKSGVDLRTAILEACPVRLRPILMTNAAIVLGMLPLALGLGKGAESRAPMAIVSIGGVIVSATLTLFLIPTLYAAFEGLRGSSADGSNTA